LCQVHLVKYKPTRISCNTNFKYIKYAEIRATAEISVISPETATQTQNCDPWNGFHGSTHHSLTHYIRQEFSHTETTGNKTHLEAHLNGVAHIIVHLHICLSFGMYVTNISCFIMSHQGHVTEQSGRYVHK
jgi:hypothetical protein